MLSLVPHYTLDRPVYPGFCTPRPPVHCMYGAGACASASSVPFPSLLPPFTPMVQRAWALPSVPASPLPQRAHRLCATQRRCPPPSCSVWAYTREWAPLELRALAGEKTPRGECVDRRASQRAQLMHRTLHREHVMGACHSYCVGVQDSSADAGYYGCISFTVCRCPGLS